MNEWIDGMKSSKGDKIKLQLLPPALIIVIHFLTTLVADSSINRLQRVHNPLGPYL